MVDRMSDADLMRIERDMEEAYQREMRENERRHRGGREQMNGDGFRGMNAFDFDRPEKEEMRGGLACRDREDWLRWFNAREGASEVAKADARMEALRIQQEVDELEKKDNFQHMAPRGELPSRNGSRPSRSRDGYGGDSKKSASTGGGGTSTRKHGSRKESKDDRQYVKIQIKVPVGQKQAPETKTRRTSSGEKTGSTTKSSDRYTHNSRDEGPRPRYQYPIQCPPNAMMGRRPRYQQGGLPPLWEEGMDPAQNFHGGNSQQTPRVNFDLPPYSNSQHPQGPRPRDDGVVYLGPRDSPWGNPSEEEMARRYPGRFQGQKQGQQSRNQGEGKIRAWKYRKELEWLAGG